MQFKESSKDNIHISICQETISLLEKFKDKMFVIEDEKVRNKWTLYKAYEEEKKKIRKNSEMTKVQKSSFLYEDISR